MDRVTSINDRIERLRKQKAKIQTQEAVLFRHEAEKIFEKGFTPELALVMLSDWTTASESKKKEWANKANSFRSVSIQGSQQKSAPREPAAHQSGKAQATENG